MSERELGEALMGQNGRDDRAMVERVIRRERRLHFEREGRDDDPCREVDGGGDIRMVAEDALEGGPVGDAYSPLGGVARLTSRTLQGIRVVLAIKAGHNDENHNQNDIGSFIVHVDGETLRDMVSRDRMVIVLVGDDTGPIRTALDAIDMKPDRFVSRPLSAKALRFAVQSGLETVARARAPEPGRARERH